MTLIPIQHEAPSCDSPILANQSKGISPVPPSPKLAVTDPRLYGAVFRAMVSVFALAVATKVVSAGKDVLVGSWFGIGDNLDALGLATVVPGVALNMLGGALGVAFLPVFIGVRERRGGPAAASLLSQVILLSVGLTVGIAIAMVLTLRLWFPLVASGFTADKIRLAERLTYEIIPALAISSISQVLAAAITASKKFVIPTLTPALGPIASMVLLQSFGKKLGVEAVALGILLGALLELGILYGRIVGLGLRVRLGWERTAEMRIVTSQFGFAALGTFLTNATTIVDNSIASRLPPGSVSGLAYASKLVLVLNGLGGTAIGTVAMPYISEMIARQEWERLRTSVATYTLKLIIPISVLVSAGLVVFSLPIVHLVFQRGAFTAANAVAVARVQACYALQIPMYVTGVLLVRVAASLSKNHVVMAIAAVGLVCSAIGAILLSRPLGAQGIALNSGIMYTVTMLLSFAYVRRQIKLREITQ